MSIPRYAIHICLVSNQSLPNLLPILHEPFRPQRVILLVTPDMKEKANLLERVLVDRGCRVERRDIFAYAFSSVREAVLQLALEQEDAAFNLTGGTKVMALGAFDIARELGIPVFYLDSREQKILLLNPREQSFPLSEVLTVKTALSAQGFTIIEKGEKQVLPHHNRLTTELVRRAEELQRPLATVNAIAQRAKESLRASINGKIQKSQEELLGLFQQAGLLEYDADRREVLFLDEKARFYVNGGWLEEHCLSVVLELQKQGSVFGLEPNVVVQTPTGVKNELDLAFTARNRLHIIECKTAKLAQSSKELNKETRATEAGYRLDTLRELAGGSFGKAMLISYQPLREVDRIRCESYGIRVVQTRRLRLLREELLQWIVESRVS
jgi:hypothetical protein